MQRLFSGAKKLEAHGGTQSFEVGRDAPISAAFRALEAAKEEGLLLNYSMSQTTLEQVFLNIAAAEGGVDA